MSDYTEVIDFLVNLVDEYGRSDLVIPEVDPTLVALAAGTEWPRSSHCRASRTAAGG